MYRMEKKNYNENFYRMEKKIYDSFYFLFFSNLRLKKKLDEKNIFKWK